MKAIVFIRVGRKCGGLFVALTSITLGLIVYESIRFTR